MYQVCFQKDLTVAPSGTGLQRTILLLWAEKDTNMRIRIRAVIMNLCIWMCFHLWPSMLLAKRASSSGYYHNLTKEHLVFYILLLLKAWCSCVEILCTRVVSVKIREDTWNSFPVQRQDGFVHEAGGTRNTRSHHPPFYSSILLSLSLSRMHPQLILFQAM